MLVIRARQAPSIAAYTYYPLESTATLLLPSPPVERAGHSTFLQYLQVKRRADERTRTADLVSLRMCGRAFLSIAGDC